MTVDLSTLHPGASFNFSQHLMGINGKRSQKTAFIDDQGKMSYGELDQAIRSMAQGLLDLGLERDTGCFY